MFENLKQALLEALILGLPDFSKQFIEELMLLVQGLVLSYHSKSKYLHFLANTFLSHLTRASTYVKELHTVVEVVKKWRQYLLVSHLS